MARRGETKARMLETAGELYRRYGYHGTGLNQILDESGAPRGSLYFHFPGGKQELAVSAIGASGREIGRGIEQVLRSTDDVGDAVSQIVAFLAADLSDSGWARGCPVGSVAMDAALTSEPVRIACGEIFAEWAGAVEHRLVETGRDAAEARELALLVISAIEGALLIARAQRDAEPLRAAGSRLRALLGTSKTTTASERRPETKEPE